MIDNMENAVALMERMEGALPMDAEITARVQEALREQSPHLALRRCCQITAVYYTGDEGGIVCTLDFGLPEAKTVQIVSITHLNFGRRNRLSRDIRVYQKRRVRRLRQIDGTLF